MKTNKGFTPIAIVLIILALLAVGGISYYAKKNSTSASQNTQTATDETANWKVFSSYGLGFKYPSDWNLRDASMDDPERGSSTLGLYSTNVAMQSTEDTILIAGGDDCSIVAKSKNSGGELSNFRCDDSSGIVITTLSKNPIVIDVFYKVLRTLTFEGNIHQGNAPPF